MNLNQILKTALYEFKSDLKQPYMNLNQILNSLI